ncbi:MAG: hypothetical protein PVF93_02650 [Chromatiaceae bacterium]|jgi:hypothetical protein
MTRYEHHAAGDLDEQTARRLRDEIETLEKRLAQIGPDGDCGYEKAMIRFFHDQIDRRRRRLCGGVAA